MKILNLNEIKDARVTDMIKFNCEMCGKDVLLQKRYFTKPLCKKCKIKDTVINRYGVTNVFNIKKSRENLDH